MKNKLLIGAEKYLLDGYLEDIKKNSFAETLYEFSSDDEVKLSQKSFFGEVTLIVRGDLNKADEERLLKNMSVDCVNTLIWVPDKVPKKKIREQLENVISFDKLQLPQLEAAVREICEDNGVQISKEDIRFLIDYSEYSTEESVTMHNLVNFIKIVSGQTVSRKTIQDFYFRNSKEDAFKILSFVGNETALCDYISRLSVDAGQLINSILYILKIVAKLKISDDIGLEQWAIARYQHFKEKLDYTSLVEMIRLLDDLREQRVSEDIAKAMIIEIFS